MEILKCINLSKKVKEKKIVENISFSINTGDIVGLIGPNGAGKTTIIKLIVGLIKMDEGNVIINGFDIKKDFTKAIEKVGAIVENPDLYMYLSGLDNLKITANNYANISNSRINEVIKIVGLEKRIKDKVSTYSLGMRQRLGIAEAILHNPKLLILDEPTNGLDIDGIIEIRTLITELSKQGIAILISSHNLSEIDKLCNRIIAIKNGRLIDDNTIDKFKSILGNNVYILEINKTEKLKPLKISFGLEILNNTTIKIYIDKEKIPLVTQKLIENNYEIYSIQEEKITSEEAFLTYKKFKEAYIKQVADEYKYYIPQELYDAMYRWEVEITD